MRLRKSRTRRTRQNLAQPSAATKTKSPSSLREMSLTGELGRIEFTEVTDGRSSQVVNRITSRDPIYPHQEAPPLWLEITTNLTILVMSVPVAADRYAIGISFLAITIGERFAVPSGTLQETANIQTNVAKYLPHLAAFFCAPSKKPRAVHQPK